MASRGRSTSNKRQKEQRRKEKQQEKAVRRGERQLTSQPLKNQEVVAADPNAPAQTSFPGDSSL
jgi:hypothetical protein